MSRSGPVFFITLAVIICIAATANGSPKMPVQNALKAISGRWYTEGHEGGIELYPCGDEICGRFYWLKDKMENGDISRDKNNPDPNLHRRPLCHMQFMGGFTPDQQSHYTDGWIYNPRDGGTYSAEMTLIDRDTLDLRGYLFFPFLGESQTWTRATSMPTCMND